VVLGLLCRHAVSLLGGVIRGSAGPLSLFVGAGGSLLVEGRWAVVTIRRCWWWAMFAVHWVCGGGLSSPLVVGGGRLLSLFMGAGSGLSLPFVGWCWAIVVVGGALVVRRRWRVLGSHRRS